MLDEHQLHWSKHTNNTRINKFFFRITSIKHTRSSIHDPLLPRGLHQQIRFFGNTILIFWMSITLC